MNIVGIKKLYTSKSIGNVLSTITLGNNKFFEEGRLSFISYSVSGKVKVKMCPYGIIEN